MKHLGILTLLGLFLTTTACEKSDPSPASRTLVGTWQLYEYGWSPGAGYFVDEVPRTPAQTITFDSNGTVSATGEQLISFDPSRKYRLVSDTTQNRDYVEFTKSDGDTYSMYVTQLTPDSLTLNPPCFEGCHYGFVRVKTPLPSKDL